jgi:flavin reductase (DIM6/NTAB) family NADH-FMN oxidoreductase RutF
MKRMRIGKAFTLMEPGPVVLVTTNDGERNNIMTISWTMVLDFTPSFAITTGPWNHSYGALRKSRECVIAIPSQSMIRNAHLSCFLLANKSSYMTKWPQRSRNGSKRANQSFQGTRRKRRAPEFRRWATYLSVLQTLRSNS